MSKKYAIYEWVSSTFVLSLEKLSILFFPVQKGPLFYITTGSQAYRSFFPPIIEIFIGCFEDQYTDISMCTQFFAYIPKILKIM